MNNDNRLAGNDHPSLKKEIELIKADAARIKISAGEANERSGLAKKLAAIARNQAGSQKQLLKQNSLQI